MTPGTHTEKAIKITSVANGYTVEMPTNEDPMKEMLSGLMDHIKNAVEGGEQSDIDKLIKESLSNVAPAPAVPTVKNIHIFTTFAEVLNFLSKEVK